jgi:hypothetical protein
LSLEFRLQNAAVKWKEFKQEETGSFIMNERLPAEVLPFHMQLFRLHGPRKNPTMRVLLIEAQDGQTVYEGFASWSECKGWIKQLSSADISTNQLAALRNLLGRNRLAAIKEVWVSLHDLESLGLHRADGQRLS